MGNNIGGLNRDWVDSAINWCRTNLQELSWSIQDKLNQII